MSVSTLRRLEGEGRVGTRRQREVLALWSRGGREDPTATEVCVCVSVGVCVSFGVCLFMVRLGAWCGWVRSGLYPSHMNILRKVVVPHRCDAMRQVVKVIVAASAIRAKETLAQMQAADQKVGGRGGHVWSIDRTLTGLHLMGWEET